MIAFGLMVGAAILGAYAFWLYTNPSIVIEWSTASELDLAGFNLYRSDAASESFEPVNSELIPPADDPLSGGDYSYTDRDVKTNTQYYYNLEEVDSTGVTTIYGPIVTQVERTGIWEALIAIWMLVGGVWTWLAARAARKRHEQSPDNE